MSIKNIAIKEIEAAISKALGDLSGLKAATAIHSLSISVSGDDDPPFDFEYREVVKLDISVTLTR